MKKARKLFGDIIYSLNDEVFLEIARNYLGPVHTPFHKPEIIDRLASFITSPEQREAIINLIDADDARILHAVYLTRRPTMEDLIHLLSDIRQYYLLRQTVVNLEERLLLLESSDGDLLLNPLLKQDILMRINRFPSIINTTSYTAAAEESILPPLQETWFAALFSRIHQRQIKLNADGTLRRNALLQLFTPLTRAAEDDQLRLERFFSLIIEACRSMGLINLADGSYQLNQPAVRELFTQYSWRQSLLTVTSHSLAGSPELVPMLDELFELLSDRSPKSREDLYRIWHVLGTFHRTEKLPGKRAALRLEELGLLIPEQESLILSPHIRKMLQEHDDLSSHPAVIDSDFTITCGPRLPDRRVGQYLAVGTQIMQSDTSYVFQVTKESCRSAFDQQYTLEQVIESLDLLSSHRIPSNVIQSVGHWRDEYDSLSIYSGIVIEASAHRARVIEKHPALQEHIIRQFSPTLFLLSAETETIWREILQSSGFDMIPDPRSAGRERQHERLDIPQSDQRSSGILAHIRTLSGSDYTDTAQFNRGGQEIRSDLLGKLEKIDLPPAERDEIRARIDKNLIISPKQLSHGRSRSAVLEAKGFDYQGKVHLVREAISSGEDLLELHLRTGDDEEEIILIKPTGLAKEGGSHLLQGETIPAHMPFSKPLRKIFLLRKLKGSLYTPT